MSTIRNISGFDLASVENEATLHTLAHLLVTDLCTTQFFFQRFDHGDCSRRFARPQLIHLNTVMNAKRGLVYFCGGFAAKFCCNLRDGEKLGDRVNLSKHLEKHWTQHFVAWQHNHCEVSCGQQNNFRTQF